MGYLQHLLVKLSQGNCFLPTLCLDRKSVVRTLIYLLGIILQRFCFSRNQSRHRPAAKGYFLNYTIDFPALQVLHLAYIWCCVHLSPADLKEGVEELTKAQ